MPKRKEPELDPKEQFKRFVETAEVSDLDEHKAQKAFKRLTPHVAKCDRKSPKDR